MKIQPLYDLQQEINRLFIAGSKFAKNDPRLSKLIPVFGKLGEKAPVFKKLASDIEELIQAEAQESAEKLSSISILLYSILYTQGEMLESEAEKKEQIPDLDLYSLSTSHSYIELKPAIQALTESNSGRLEIVQDAHKRGIFKDFRTYEYLVDALGDRYSELAIYVAEVIKESSDKTIIPFLLKNFSYDGSSEDVRRMQLLHHFEYSGINKMITRIMEGKSPALQAEAIKIMAENPENEEFITQLIADKNKQVREAAYEALAILNTSESTGKLKDIFLKNKTKTNLSGIVSALAMTSLTYTLFSEIFDKVQQTFQELLAFDKNTVEKVFLPVFDKFKTELEVLKNKDYEETYRFLEEIIINKNFQKFLEAKNSSFRWQITGLYETLTGVLATLPKMKVVNFLENVTPKMGEYPWLSPIGREYLDQAVKNNYSKEKIFDLFSESYKKGIIGINDLHYSFCIQNPEYSENGGMGIKDGSMIDPRWTDIWYLEISTKNWDYHAHSTQLRLIDLCDSHPSKRLNKVLVKFIDSLKPDNKGYDYYSYSFLFNLLMKNEVENKFEIIYQNLSQYKKGNRIYSISDLVRQDFWYQFPKEYVEKFRELYKKSYLNLFNDIADKIEFRN